ncbi:hypothetical protein CWB96_00100 [Pseudoalteromonas citrea]|uniref:Uncharacterized protein n=1 Tax=Pseudoalteromonas citrea TaxID=43655 RepID=A0A5S3XVA5_9GAMM|nr:hypothetical protein [Pseudoalteromonas citrea]TMP46267.1 hypothetical protein CWB97_02095 [Pseudoalteromonas citrea]TMP63043.1 hypothetical protein CWB96_00100 [Pseudoalteromonas citrea]
MVEPITPDTVSNERVNTLLTRDDIQHMLHIWGSPATIYNYPRQHGNYRRYFIHAFTGRVPTASEIYYGTYIHRQGDLFKTAAHNSISDAHVGYIIVQTDHPSHSYGYKLTEDCKMSGPIFPEGSIFTNITTHTIWNMPQSGAKKSWMLDWEFSAKSNKVWVSGNRDNLRAWHEESKLAFDKKPTWFFISDSAHLPMFSDVTRVTDQNGNAQAVIQAIDMTDTAGSDRWPLVYGTIGSVGSGADLETAEEDSFDHARLISLRVTTQ